MNTLGERKLHPPKDGKISMICYLYRSGEGDDSLARSFDSYELRRVCESVPAAEDDPVVEPHKEVGTGDL